MNLAIVKKTDPNIRVSMAQHYSEPRGFVGRSICYAIYHDDILYGHTVGGSATRFLPGRHEYLGTTQEQLNNIVNNIFFHVYRNPRYPIRNFVPAVIRLWRERVTADWQEKYGDTVYGFETLVEPPRTGECYLRDGWVQVGVTKGYTCKRVAGKGTDSWTGKRVWDTENLRPKLVFCKKVT
jgi:hypothetical protein